MGQQHDFYLVQSGNLVPRAALWRGFLACFQQPSLLRPANLDSSETIGEAASATVVSRSDDEWRFCFEANPELVSLCTIPLKGYKDFCEDDGNLGLNGVNGFVSFGIELFDAAVERMVDLSRSEIVDLEGPDIWLPQAAAADPCRRAAALLGIDRAKFYQEVFPPYGNLVSASIPMGMRMALDEGRLRRGDRVVLCPASAGMVFSIVEFTF